MHNLYTYRASKKVIIAALISTLCLLQGYCMARTYFQKYTILFNNKVSLSLSYYIILFINTYTINKVSI